MQSQLTEEVKYHGLLLIQF